MATQPTTIKLRFGVETTLELLWERTNREPDSISATCRMLRDWATLAEQQAMEVTRATLNEVVVQLDNGRIAPYTARRIADTAIRHIAYAVVGIQS